ncbi:MAG: hypothetical protein DRR19_05025 [Candidatus Parabeggiatoa sp. nov. 1]|nr:MAG: hypothetical protein DRR19_05025 [Gammaproteobacteria bacterium]
MMNTHTSSPLDSVTPIRFFRSLRGKLVLLFLAVSLIPLITVGLLTYTQAKNALKAEVINKLVAVRDIKAKRIEKYFKECLDDVKLLSKNPSTVAAIRAFDDAIHAEMKKLGTDENGAMKKHSRSLYLGKPYLVNADDGSAYSTAHAQYHAMFKAYKETYGFYDILLVEAHAGRIVYSVVKEDDFDTSLETGPYAGTNMGHIFQKSLVATDRDFTKLEDFAYYETSKEAASFVASPIFDNKVLMGVLIFQLSTAQIDAIMQENTGLGKTGETILISSEDLLLRSNSRFSEESTLLTQKVDTEATRASAVGEAGVKIIRDYRGELTIVAYRPLDIAGVRWSLNAKVDEAEAFAKAQQMLFWILIIIGLGAAIAVATAFWFSVPITKPVQIMTDVTHRLADGNMNLTVTVKNQDEIGQMGNALGQMIVNLRLVVEDIVQISQGLAQGDLRVTPKTEYKGEFAQIKNAQEMAFSELQGVIKDIVQMSQGLAQGNLHVTPQAEYRGDFVQIKNALEMAFSELQGVIKDIVQMSQGLAQGNLHVTPQADYRGDFVQIKNAREVAFSELRQIVEDIVQVSQGLAEGNLRVRHHAEYRGDFLKIKNAQKIALSNLWQVIEDIVQVSQGLAEGRLDIRPKGEYHGDFVQVKNALEMASAKLAETTKKNATQDWLKTGQTELNEKMRGEQTPAVLTQNIINYLATYLNAQVGAFFLAQGEGFKLVSSYAYKQRNNNYNEFKLGEGLIGQAALEKKSILFTQVPEEHCNLSINSGISESSPHTIFILPLIYEQEVLGVLELASSRHFTATEIELLDQVADNIAITLNTAQSHLRMQALLEDSKQLTLSLKNQQKEVIESEERVRAIVETVIDAIIIIDGQGIIESINPAAEQIFDYMWSDVVGQHVNMLMPELPRSQHDQNIDYTNLIGQVREVVGQHQDGSNFPLEISLAEMQHGDTHLFTCIARDITERKKAENALQQQQEELQTSNEELQSQSEELQTQQEELRQFNEELEERTKELEQQKNEIYRKNLVLEQNQIEMEKAKAALETKAKELELASQYKSEFLANMSHELRTPLNSLLILAQLLAENKTGNLTENQAKYAQTIHSAGSDLLTLINDILDLSKVEAGKMEVYFADMPLFELTAALKQKFCHVAEKKGLAFQMTVADDLPPMLHTDAQRLQQIINNLLSNAFKFTSKGEIKLTIRHPLSNEDISINGIESGKTIAFSVADMGIGISEDKQKLIFEAFQQADGTTSRRYGGTGLGLSISRQLARLLGGHLKLESEEGKGSIFTLYLPEVPIKASTPSFYGIESLDNIPDNVSASSYSGIENEPLGGVSAQTSTPMSGSEPLDSIPAKALTPLPVPAEAKASIPLPSSSEPQEVGDDRNTVHPDDKSILIIEDDHNFSYLLMELAQEKGFKCIVAEDGKSGLQFAQEYQPNAIILDVGLPQLDGWTVMERLKDNPDTRHIPVHFMSVSELSMEAKKMGAIGYLLKPVSMEELGEAFKKIEQFIAKAMKHLLIVVENKQRQRKIQGLVGDGEVKLTVAASKADAIHHLHNAQFDCIIFDVGVEPQSGLQFLKSLQQEDTLAQIPVIIYAERELTLQEEQILQECEANLTVKAVISPERLLDETTLFLHQVEANLPKDKRQMLRMVHNKELLLRNKKVLLVDDDIRNTFALMTFLEGKEMNVLVAENGKEALESLDEQPDITIILMDIMMPEMDGYEAIRKIRAQPQHRKLPIIAITAKAMKGDKTKCLEAGANEYICKPVDTEKLISLMRVWLYR